MVTHDPRIAAHADRLVFLKDGSVVDETILEGQGADTEAVAKKIRQAGQAQ
jgi:putative ABC transport system ATP-binding protein